MRLSAIIPIALAAAPVLVSGAGTLGFALGDKTAEGNCKDTSDYAADFKALGATSKLVRIYAASDCYTAAKILPAAEAAGFQVILGIWPDTDESFQNDKAAVVQYAPQYAKQVYAITVGSETLYRGNFTGETLLQKIQDVKQAVPQFKVGTADSWNKFQDGTADPLIKGNVDILLCNGFSYWQGQTIANATKSFFDDVMQAFGHIQETAGTTGGPELWVGETGWPTAGSTYQAAVPGVTSAAEYWSTGICGILAWGVNVFSFEAFDEPWKPKSVGQDGSVADETHWGVFNADRTSNISRPFVFHINGRASLGLKTRETEPQTTWTSFALVSTGANIHRLSSLVSSPPPVASAQDGIIAKHSGPQVTPGSPAPSTTSTAEGGSSPVLPPLPAPKINGRVLDLLKTPPSETRTGSSRYFTASWGSPYPESSDGTSEEHLHRRSLSSDISEDSPLRRLELHTPFLRPAPTFARSETEPSVAAAGGVSAAVLANRARRPARGLTEDWIRQHTEAGTTERLNWLSDNPESETSSEGVDWLGDEFDPRTPTLKSFVGRRVVAGELSQHSRQKSTDTLRQADFEDEARDQPSKMSNASDSVTVEPLGEMAIARKGSARKHVQHSRAQSSIDTIRDVLGKAAARNNSISKPPMAELSEFKETEPETQLEKLSPILDKELPPPPTELLEEKPTESSEWTAASLPMVSRRISESTVLLSSASPAPAPPRLKKKVAWKGKNIVIQLPLDEERGQQGKAPMPMTLTDVERMLHDWVQLGYNVTGFNLGTHDPADAAEVYGQSRVVWPEAEEMYAEREARNFRVSIPDRRDWDAYVEQLKEAKLRALGVSLGDEDPVSTISPSASAMSRQTSTQYPQVPFSPPVPTSSATSGHMHHPSLFSPALLAGAGPSTSQSSNVGSVASPASMHAQIYGKYNPRQSISVGTGEHGVATPFQLAQQQSPGVWSPQQMLYQPGLVRGGSPSLQSLGGFVSPMSPYPQDSYFQQAEVANQLHQRQQQLQNQLQQHMSHPPSSTQSPRMQEIRPHDVFLNGSKSPSKTPEASQFIRRNPSDSLQKEIDDAEYHLEEQFQRQLEHDDYSPHSEKGDTIADLRDINTKPPTSNQSAPEGLNASRFADPDGPVLHHPQPHSRGHSLSQRPFGNREDVDSPELGPFAQPIEPDTPELDTNTSQINTPVLSTDLSGLSHHRSFSSSSNPWLDSEPTPPEPATSKAGHGSKPSMSKLNVAAPEFKFNPSKAFNPGQLTFGGGGFQPALAANPSFVPIPAPPVATTHSVNGSIGNNIKGASKINVAAPVFKPGHSDFSFSSSGPMFRPNAPAFTPGKSTTEPVGSGQSSAEGPDPRKSIFGKIDMTGLAGIVKPQKKSKAIPIIRPDSSGNNNATDDGLVEGLDGRITQGTGRTKRTKASRNDGDSVPLFATPSPEPSMPLQETTRDQSPPKEITPVVSTDADKENLSSATGKDTPLRIVPQSTVKALRSQSKLEDSPDYDGKGWASFEFQQQQQVQDFNVTSAFPVRSPALHKPVEQKGNAEQKEEESPRKETFPSPPSPHSSPSPPSPPTVEDKPKGHKKNSLSALAKPFEFNASNWFGFSSKDSVAKEKAVAPPVAAPEPVSTPAAKRGLSSSKYAAASPSPSPPPQTHPSPEITMDRFEQASFQDSLPPQDPPPYHEEEIEEEYRARSPTFEEIDAVMRHMNEAEPDRTVNRDTDTPHRHEPAPIRQIEIPDPAESSPTRIQPQNLLRSDAPSPSPRRFQPLPGDHIGQRVFSRVHDDPFVGESLDRLAFDSPVHNLNHHDSVPPSDWDDMLSESQEPKFHARSHFFDHHVNDLVGGLLAERLDPLEKALETIQDSLTNISTNIPSNRRARRSFSGEPPESDADDEDDEEQDQRRSTSPRKDRKWEKMRSIVREVLVAHQASPALQPVSGINAEESSNVLQALEEMREQFGQSMRLDLRGEDLRNIVEEAVERRMPASPKPVVDEAANAKIAELQAKVLELTQRAGNADEKAEEEVKNRRAAEDRLAEVQRLLRISSEEEDRLREAVEDKEQKLKTINDTRSKSSVRTALLEANAQNALKNQSEMGNKLTIMETDLRQARQDAQRWQFEAEKISESAKRSGDEARSATESNIQMTRAVESLKLQMEESLRVREDMRFKLGGLQDDMARAAREISQENAKRAKKEQELIARQEVLDARLQAEARTRERLEREIERLEGGEREGMRAISESKRLEVLVSGLQNELHNAQKNVMKYQREFEEARESGLSEVQRTRHYLQAEVEAANNQVNMVRQDLEDQVSRLRSELDQVKLDADTGRERSEMLLEEAVETKSKELDTLKRKHDNEVEDLQTRHDRQLGNAVEDHQRSEQLLLERLSLSSSKTEHLQDRIAHLEERLEIAKTAALAAAQAARSASVSVSESVQKTFVKSPAKSMELPEKISPQALRESIMVLQEQLQDREQTIEKLEQKLSTVDLDAPNKISKRDDEITWLRELLAVRVGDLQDIITTVSQEEFDPAPVKDAAIRLKANLQMEQQERERAMSGMSMLPNIAASLKDAATPRVAQVVGPMAAAWGNWRKSQESGSTPSKAAAASSPHSFLSGLLTPPASSARTPPSQQQPTAFNSTGRRFTAQQLANRPLSRRQEKMPAAAAAGAGVPAPQTPPMMRKASYDMDAHPREEDFGDAGFFDEDEGARADGGLFRAGR